MKALIKFTSYFYKIFVANSISYKHCHQHTLTFPKMANGDRALSVTVSQQLITATIIAMILKVATVKQNMLLIILKMFYLRKRTGWVRELKAQG